MLKPYKFIVQAVLIDEQDGRIVGEASSDPAVVFGLDALVEWAKAFPGELERINGSPEPKPRRRPT